MKEVELPIETNGQYKNVYLKENLNRGQKGLDPMSEDFIIVKKKFPQGKDVNGKFGISYSCAVEYQNQDVSFWLTPAQHEEFAKCGGVDDKIRVIATLKDKFDGGKYKTFRFEKVE